MADSDGTKSRDGTRNDVQAFYDAYGIREWDRLDRDFFHRLEWEGTVEQLEARLDDPAGGPGRRHVLDVGGGPGRYSIWLAERGYDVTLVELSQTQRELAREQLATHGVTDRVTVHAGDVRDLGFADDTFDATCCLGGPLSHVLDATRRAHAATELRRVTRPGAPVFVSVMGLLGMVLLMVESAGRGDGGLAAMPDLVREQNYTAELLERHGLSPAMADCHFFRRAELVDLLESAGLEIESVAALEGVAASRRRDLESLDTQAREIIRILNEQLRHDPTVADISTHLLATCRA